MGCCVSPPPKEQSGFPGAGTDAHYENNGLIMGKYDMGTSAEDVMGEGTSSICRVATDTTASGKKVAIKVYKKQNSHGGKVDSVTLQKFKRQISVLTELQEPFKPLENKKLWCEDLNRIKPSRVFMVLLDYSKGKDRTPGPDPRDGVMYVVTELASYSLKDFLSHRREEGKPLSEESVKNITRAILLAMMSLHAKGFVHLDMKPENLMMFDGRLKVIDVDGCARIGSTIKITDSTISFSPCYCAPEWARFLISEEPNASIIADPSLDVWSVAMTLCELVSLDAILKPMYASFLRNAHSHREAGFMFMESLGDMKTIMGQFPASLKKYDPAFVELIVNGVGKTNSKERATCAQALAMRFAKNTESSADEDKKMDMGGDAAPRQIGARVIDESTQIPLHKGTLWKLNSNGDPKNLTHWIRRDMWIAHNHSLCYFSLQEGKKLVLIDGTKLATALLAPTTGFAREFTFDVKLVHDSEEKDREVMRFAADNQQDLKEWMKMLKNATRMEILVTMRLGHQMEKDVRAFHLGVKNRRLKVKEGDKANFEPVFKANLWKVKGEGDRSDETHWWLREMWIAKNGSLVYWSKKEERELIYYTASDLQRATVKQIHDTDSCKPYYFQIILPPADGVEFSPGEFAAETQQEVNVWLSELAKVCGEGSA
eukprot:TRINITY_DN28863_c0_g1_i1.p1 TRINITY_DN28863_c0_g1~~TRINITY_DN28863_c0_g1_i1.p1  ORF type:complete len:657 (+),score=131.05 TRINITY_DN28863_c0_g1_i1:104-2074(+)